MPEIINIEIIEKHATTLGAPVIVCGNAGYSLQFSFDSEWDGLDPKIARFVYVSNGLMQCEEVEFTGNTVEVPVLINTREVMVGVYTDTLCTSTPARIPCELSIRCLAAVPGTNGGGTGGGGGAGGGGVTDYNDLTNKPITYIKGHTDLDELTSEGVYIVDGFTCTLLNGDRQRFLFPAFVHNYDNRQDIQCASCYIARIIDNGEWMGMVYNYEHDQKLIHPLYGEEIDGVVSYSLEVIETLHNPYRSVTISQDCTFHIPTHESHSLYGYYLNKSYLVYAHVTEAVSIGWGADVLFYDGQVPVIEPGYYDIIFTFDPNAEKWCVGVLRKGAAE